MVAVYRRRSILLALCSIAILAAVALYRAPEQGLPRRPIPDRITDSEFWGFVTDFSEPDGYFRSDNFVSNESAFQQVIPDLKRRIKRGGIYVGVGPDQNFTYIGALEPKVAFIVDIRRQNLLLHLMYKALFELSDNRTEFLSKLFGRPVPDLPLKHSPEQLFAAFGATVSDPALADTTLQDILQHLRGQHHFALSSEDVKTIRFVYNSFVSAGPEIRYSFPNQYAWRRFPSFSELMLETDGTSEEGSNHSYMASEENFQRVKRIESENRIIPIVGDFAGEKALRQVGRYIRDHGATISTFYTSNVEFYLFQSEDWRKFFQTVSEFPVDKDSVFIRSFFNNSLQFPNPPAALNSPPQSYTLVDPISSLLNAHAAGRIETYYDVVRRSRP
jgi:hypothetical protein